MCCKGVIIGVGYLGQLVGKGGVRGCEESGALLDEIDGPGG